MAAKKIITVFGATGAQGVDWSALFVQTLILSL
jgi:hypothetical protein